MNDPNHYNEIPNDDDSLVADVETTEMAQELAQPDSVVDVESTENTQSDSIVNVDTIQTEEQPNSNDSSQSIVEKIISTTPQRRSSGRYFSGVDVTVKCFNCLKIGHYSRDCTNERAKKPCFLCGHPEHSDSTKKCPNRLCDRCFRKGHDERECRYKQYILTCCSICGDHNHTSKKCKFSTKGATDVLALKQIRCMVCGGMGHLNCTKQPISAKPFAHCSNCSATGHLSHECPDPPMANPTTMSTVGYGGSRRSRSGSNNACFRCGGTDGHIARDCPTKDNMICYHCGETGHLSRSCRSTQKRRRDSDVRRRSHRRKDSTSRGTDTKKNSAQRRKEARLKRFGNRSNRSSSRSSHNSSSTKRNNQHRKKKRRTTR